jgi:hypothetical protein
LEELVFGNAEKLEVPDSRAWGDRVPVCSTPNESGQRGDALRENVLSVCEAAKDNTSSMRQDALKGKRTEIDRRLGRF